MTQSFGSRLLAVEESWLLQGIQGLTSSEWIIYSLVSLFWRIFKALKWFWDFDRGIKYSKINWLFTSPQIHIKLTKLISWCRFDISTRLTYHNRIWFDWTQLTTYRMVIHFCRIFFNSTNSPKVIIQKPMCSGYAYVGDKIDDIPSWWYNGKVGYVLRKLVIRFGSWR